jgi:hypothetical protein
MLVKSGTTQLEPVMRRDAACYVFAALGFCLIISMGHWPETPHVLFGQQGTRRAAITAFTFVFHL